MLFFIFIIITKPYIQLLENMTATIDYEQFIIENQDKLIPGRIHAELSYNMYGMARKSIKDMFNNENMREKSAIIGYTSNCNRSHILYCSKNGILYILYNWQGVYNDMQYFTRAMMMDYFENYENEAPAFEETDFVRNALRGNETLNDISRRLDY